MHSIGDLRGLLFGVSDTGVTLKISSAWQGGNSPNTMNIEYPKKTVNHYYYILVVHMKEKKLEKI